MSARSPRSISKSPHTATVRVLQFVYLGGVQACGGHVLSAHLTQARTELVSTVSTASPESSIRSRAQKNATCAGEWPGVSTHVQSGRPGTRAASSGCATSTRLGRVGSPAPYPAGRAGAAR